MNIDESGDVERLVARLRELGPLEAQPPGGRASSRYDHIGAKLADAVLQRGVNYEAFVRPRVDRIVRDYPTGQTTSGFLALLRSEGAATVLELRAGRKPRTVEQLAQFFVDRGVETTSGLVTWLQRAGSSSSLMTVYGVGPKTISFLKLLVGLDAIAVDRPIVRFVQQAGVAVQDRDHVEAILTKAGRLLGLTGAQVDQLIWRAMAAQDRRIAIVRPATST